MSKNPLISVITPTYNSEKFIRDSIESVLNQTYSNWEMIIVDDASKDKTVEVIHTYIEKDDRIKLIQLKENSGSAISRNTAMDNANGRYIAFLDSDDLWLPKKLEIQVRFMMEQNIAFSYTRYRRIKVNGEKTNGVSKYSPVIHYEQLMKQCIIGCLTVMLDMEKVGDERMINIRTRQDYAMWLSLMKKGFPAYGIPQVLSHYRLVPTSISSNKMKAARKNWELYRHIEGHHLVKSMWYFVNYAINSVVQVIKFKILK